MTNVLKAMLIAASLGTAAIATAPTAAAHDYRGGTSFELRINAGDGYYRRDGYYRQGYYGRRHWRHRRHAYWRHHRPYASRYYGRNRYAYRDRYDGRRRYYRDY